MAQAPAPAAQQGPKQMHSFELDSIDKSVSPCADFYQYACGNWMKNNPIPADQSSWGRFDELFQNNQFILRDILQKAAAGGATRDANTQKIGDFYGSCMDEEAIEKKGLASIKPELDMIAALKSKSELPDFLAEMHKNGFRSFFEFGSQPDFKNAQMMIAETDQSGLGLPERDYYFKDDAKSKELREKYVQHVANMFVLAGDSKEKAAAKAQAVMTLETNLAKASLDVTSRRDPQKVYHKMTAQELAALSPAFDWNRYIKGMPAPQFDSLNVAVPEFVKGFNGVVQSTSLDDIKTYLQWHALHYAHQLLPKKFVDEDFKFYGKTLTGQAEIQPRWKRCVNLVDGDLGEALGKAYVDQAFGPEAKARMLSMVHNLEHALNADIKDLPWMTEATKKQALVKLNAMANKIGYPDKWRDYSSVTIDRTDLLGNDQRATAFEIHRQLNKIGKPTDKTEWGMTPPTVNAYYNPLENNINFPAGILQPPFFDITADEAINYGGIGSVIGHEMTHGFDDEGRQFDAEGNLKDWWTPADAKAFEQNAQCFVDEYGKFSPIDDVKLNGKLTLGENTADNGGLRIALMALGEALKDSKTEKGFTPEQRVFLGYAQEWCENIRSEAARMYAQVDPHSPGRFRVNGVLTNMPEFVKAYGCKPGDQMVKAPQCRVW
jgi:endothelin-converting enzyme/putative endopeptidase